MYQPFTGDVSQMKGYREELAVVIYLFNLNSDLSSQTRGHIIGADSVLDLQAAFSKVLRISIGIPTSSPEPSAMATTRGRGRGSHRGGGRGCSDSGGCPKCSHCGRLRHRVD